MLDTPCTYWMFEMLWITSTMLWYHCGFICRCGLLWFNFQASNTELHFIEVLLKLYLHIGWNFFQVTVKLFSITYFMIHWYFHTFFLFCPNTFLVTLFARTYSRIRNVTCSDYFFRKWMFRITCSVSSYQSRQPNVYYCRLMEYLY